MNASLVIVLAIAAACAAAVKLAPKLAPAARAFGWSPKQPTMVLIDVDAGIPLADMQAWACGLQAQLVEDVAPIWGFSAAVRVATPAAPWKPGELRIEMRRAPQAGDEGALAVHDVDEHGNPLARVFPFLCRLAGDDPCVATSHELIELLGDPLLTDCVQLPDGRIAAKELCDQVQTQSYSKCGVNVSNFVTPQNFAPSKSGEDRYDFLGKLTACFEVADGGYAQVLEAGKGWVQLGHATGYRAMLKQYGIPSRGTQRGSKHL